MEVCIKQSLIYSWLGKRQRYDWISNSFFLSIQSRNTLWHIVLIVAELGRAQQHKSMGCSDEVSGRKLVPLSTAWQDYALSLINHRQGVQCIDFYLSILLWKKKRVWGNSLAVQWLGLSAFNEMAWVQSLVGELRSPKPWGIAKKKIKN